MRPVIMVFAKVPEPGRVKTRLVPYLDPETAAALYAAFVLDTLESLEALSAIAEVELHTDRETDAWASAAVPRRLQHEGDLGLKMLKALGGALERGHPRALILGSDSPDLPPAYVTDLLAARADVALGPTQDGGYYGISASRIHPAMFQGVRWSTEHALEDSLSACASCGLTTALGSPWFDVDEPPSIERLAFSGWIPTHTRAVLDAVAGKATRSASASGSKRA